MTFLSQKGFFKATMLLLFFTSLTQALLAQTPVYQSFSRSIPNVAYETLKEFQTNRRKIDLLAFNRDDQWVLVSDNYRSYSNVEYFNNNGLRPKITEYVNAGLHIDAIAFAPNNAWVLIAEDHQWFRNVRYFKSIGLYDKLRDLKRLNKRIASVSIGPSNCWVVITKDGGIYYSSNLRTKVPTLWYLLIDCKNNAKRPVQFVNIIPPLSRQRNYPQGVRWVLIADDYYWSDNWTTEAKNKLENYRSNNWEVHYVALRPSGGWSIIANNSFVAETSNQTASTLERGLRTSSSSAIKYNIYERMKYHNVPGVSIVVIKNDSIALARGYGTAKANTDEPVLANRTLFPAASMSKAMASLAWTLLASSKPNLSIDDDLEEIVSNFRLSRRSHFMQWYNAMLSTDSRVKNITVRQLLSHTSGLNTHGVGQDSLNNVGGLDDILMNGNSPRVTFNNSPGTIWDYSGGGYTVAEALLEAITGSSSKTYVDRKILTPLNMHKSRFDTPSGVYYAIGHDSNGIPISRGDCPGEFAGGLITTPTEYAQFVLALMNDGKVNNSQLFPKANIDLMLTNNVKFSFIAPCTNSCTTCFAKAGSSESTKCAAPFRNFESNTSPKAIIRYGLGLNFSEQTHGNNYPNRFSHGGKFNNGYRCRFWAYKEIDEAIIIMTNGTSEWTDSSGNTRGANELILEIRQSFFDNY
ncbi:MAG: hypothetical protein CL843_06885 [Crocinitomicaceae bacterium]|nr:hypothetical protein [Crocinitomicaceae bacterium]|tara:strand:+ start:1340 stop:3415 length:2076 start_codon:yes stop_codon:yes gene_type:complete